MVLLWIILIEDYNMYHPTMSRTGRILFYPLIKVCEWMGENHPVTLIKIRYFATFHRFPNLKNPQTFNEKILYIKLFTDTSKWTVLADKYKVRDYIKECGLGDCLIPLLGMWTDVNDIDFDSLPHSFIFKANNGVGKSEHLMVEDKNKLDVDASKKFLNKLLKAKHVGVLAAEPQYKNMPPCIIAEELLPSVEGEKSPVDYKIFCFNGEPKFIRTYSNRDKDGADVSTYDTLWNPMPEVDHAEDRYHAGKHLPKPVNLEEMVRIAALLAKPFPFVRVDLYNINGKIYFGELTFTPLGGLMSSMKPEVLDKMGEMIDLNYPNNL